MKALVTGGTGFLGRHLVKALLDQGVSVRMFLREHSHSEDLENGRAQIVRGDITSRESLRNVAGGVDVIFHLAAQMGAWGVPSQRYAAVNIRGTANLLQEGLEAGIKQFIFASTPGVQGKGYASAREDLPYNPPYDYERTKCQAEMLCKRIGKEKGLSVTIIRPDFVYGPGDTRRLGLYRAIQRKRFFVVGNGKSLLHPTYIDDVVQGFLLVAENPVAIGETYNIGAWTRYWTSEPSITTKSHSTRWHIRIGNS